MEERVINSEQSNGIGVAGFILSILALFLGWIPFIGWVMWVLGLIFSAIGISKAKKIKKGMGLSVAGLVISLIGVVLIIVFAGVIAGMAAFS